MQNLVNFMEQTSSYSFQQRKQLLYTETVSVLKGLSSLFIWKQKLLNTLKAESLDRLEDFDLKGLSSFYTF